jgi:LysM repeat protein
LFAAVALVAYLVQPGDTLSGIAASHGVSLAAVEAANPQIANPNLIFVGQSVKIPAGSAGQSSSSAGTSHSAGTTSSASDSSAAGRSYQSTASQSAGSSSQQAASTYRSPSSISSVTSRSTSTGSSGYSSSSLSDVPGVPQSFAACVAYRESTNLQNPAANGNAYGIIPSSGYNVNGTSLANQKQVFAKLYAQYGSSPWAPSDGC